MYNDVSERNINGRILYSEFVRKYEKNKELFDKVVANFDQHGLRLKTQEEDSAVAADKQRAKNTVDRTAKRASSKLLKK